MKNFLFLLILILTAGQIYAQAPSQKYALRGVWLTTVGQYDWPSTAGTSASVIASQKSELVSMLDAHKTSGMNAMFFNIRVDCDALYKSNIEPWSRFLTGTQGVAPSDPNYDPLQFAIGESHKRGMELHAWINPYKAVRPYDSPDLSAPTHVTRLHPDWIIKCSSTEYRFLDPGLPQVREYLVKVIMDIVRRYDVDGIHFDDFFYPYSDYGTFNDDATFNKYKGSFTDRAKWRINNVNMLLSMVNDSIKAVKPWVKFGISPAGNSGVNLGIYVDPAAWLRGDYVDTLNVSHTGTPYIDYIMPQLYWVGYGGNLGNWTSSSFLNGRHLYIGLPAYRYGESQNGFTPNELGWEIRTNRSIAAIGGEVYFRSQHLTPSNVAGCVDSLMHNYYVYPALTPKMSWKPGINMKPNAPSNLRIEKNSTSGKYEIKWDKPSPALNGDTAFSYVIYRFDNPPSAADLENPAKMFGTTGQTVFLLNNGHFSATSGQYYAVTAVDRYSNESSMSNVYNFTVTDQIPAASSPATPSDGDQNQSTYAVLTWSSSPSAECYQVQASLDSTFKDVICNQLEMKRTSYVLWGILPAKKYYWRVRAFGISGPSQFSKVYTFASGVPVAPVLLEPKHTSTGAFLNPLLKWAKAERAASYRIQLGSSALMTAGIILDTTVTDTCVSVSGLAANKIYYWRVMSKNTLGQSDWSGVNGFKTGTTTSVTEENTIIKGYSLDQNFPNPFNPVTRITYSLEKDGYVKLSVFNLLGQEVAVLVDKYQNAGSYNTSFDVNNTGKNLTSGIYFYTLRTADHVLTRKMTILK